jgi:hypothetical protein
LSHIRGIVPSHSGLTSFINLFNQIASLAASQAATNSDSVEDNVTHGCLRLAHATGPPFRMKMKAVVDRHEFESPAKSESEYPLRRS